MYSTKRLASGGALLCSLWLLAGLLVMSTGVGMAVPLSGAGGFNTTATYMSAERATVQAGLAETTEHNQRPVAVFEITESEVRQLRITKTLSLEDMPGLNGQLRIVMGSPNSGTIEGITFKTDRLVAEQAIWRGFVMDERNTESPFDRLQSSAGPNPSQTATAPVDVEGSGSEPGFELTNARIEMYSLSADRVQISDLTLVVQYDPDGDGDYEYGG